MKKIACGWMVGYGGAMNDQHRTSHSGFVQGWNNAVSKCLSIVENARRYRVETKLSPDERKQRDKADTDWSANIFNSFLRMESDIKSLLMDP